MSGIMMSNLGWYLETTHSCTVFGPVQPFDKRFSLLGSNLWTCSFGSVFIRAHVLCLLELGYMLCALYNGVGMIVCMFITHVTCKDIFKHSRETFLWSSCSQQGTTSVCFKNSKNPQIMKSICTMVKSRYIGMVIPPLIGILIMGI